MERKLGLAITRNCYHPCDWRNQELSCARTGMTVWATQPKLKPQRRSYTDRNAVPSTERQREALWPCSLGRASSPTSPTTGQPNQNPLRKRTLEIQFARVVPLVKQSREGVKNGSESKQAYGWHNPPFLLINSCSIFPPIFISQTLSTTCLYHSHK